MIANEITPCLDTIDENYAPSLFKTLLRAPISKETVPFNTLTTQESSTSTNSQNRARQYYDAELRFQKVLLTARIALLLLFASAAINIFLSTRS